MFLDSNLDGVLTVDELANGIDKLHLFELLQDSTKENENCYNVIMQKCDLDGDGKIDYAEFIQATIEHKALLNQRNIEMAFKMFDLDGDGSISIDEMRHMFSDKIVNSTAGEKLLEEIMNEVDANNDNVISYEEFNNAMTVILRKSVKTLEDGQEEKPAE